MWLFGILLMVVTISSVSGCPSQCRCSLDERGRKKVQCESGGMRDPIPVLKMSQDTEVLIITGPPYRPNTITLGPIFKELRKLEEIHITWSGVPALGDHSLWGLRRLHVLNLTHNTIESLRATNFKGADSIRHLDLSFNEIESVPSAVFMNVKHLKSLTLAQNRLAGLAPRIFFGLSHLEHLDLSLNPLGDLLPERFTDCPDLKTLSCTGCGLMTISTSLLEKLTKLHYLDLRDNRLTQVPHNINLLKELVTLRLDGNHISFLEQNIVSGSSLRKLHLSHNRIISVEENAFTNTSLTHLDLSYNRIPHLEEGSLDDVLDQLVDIRLSGNSLYVDELKAILPKARNLRHLGLGDMGLTKLPSDMLMHAKHLHHFNISANYLQKIPLAIISSSPHLRVLDLSSNSFRGMDEEFVEYLTNVKELRILKLEGNPWQCDHCHVSAMLRWLQAAPDQESGCSDKRVWSCLKCVGPKGFSGTSLALLPPGDLPACSFTTPVRPTWLGPTLSNAVITAPKRIPQSDQPRLPHGPLTLQEQEWSFNRFVEEQLVLVVVIGSILILFLLMVVVVAVFAYNRHSAYYYTYENHPGKTTQKMVRHKHNNNSTAKQTTMFGDKSDPTIAVIDELTNIAGSTEILDPKQDCIPELENEPRPGSN